MARIVIEPLRFWKRTGAMSARLARDGRQAADMAPRLFQIVCHGPQRFITLAS